MLCKVCRATDGALFYPSIKTYCREHWKEKVRKNRLEKIDHYRSFDLARSSMPHRVAARKAYQATEHGKIRASAARRAWEERHPLKKKATTALNNAVRRGKVQPQPCLVCGDSAEAHHPSYSLPLDVVWLCDTHHKQVHKEAREYEREAA